LLFISSFQCRMCKTAFSSRSNCVRHVMSRHGILNRKGANDMVAFVKINLPSQIADQVAAEQTGEGFTACLRASVCTDYPSFTNTRSGFSGSSYPVCISLRAVTFRTVTAWHPHLNRLMLCTQPVGQFVIGFPCPQYFRAVLFFSRSDRQGQAPMSVVDPSDSKPVRCGVPKEFLFEIWTWIT